MDTEGQRALGVSLREAFKIEKKCEIFHTLGFECENSHDNTNFSLHFWTN